MMQKGVLPLVKSVTPSRIKENYEVFDFELSEKEMFEIASLKTERIGADPDTCDFSGNRAFLKNNLGCAKRLQTLYVILQSN